MHWAARFRERGRKVMKKTEKEILDFLGEEITGASENAEVPLKLRKESIVAMLKNNEGEEKDFSAKTGTDGKIVVLRRLTAVAAVLVVVVVAALFMRTGGVKVIKTDTFYKGYESVEPVKSVRSYEEVERAVLEILGNKEESKAPQSNKDSTQGVTQSIVDRLIEGYSNYVADDKSAEKADYTADKTKPEASTGVVSYGDFTADIVKTDGRYLYIVTTGVDEKTGAGLEQIKIVKALPAEEMQVVSTVVLADGSDAGVVNECIEIYVKNNRLIALMNSYTYSMDGSAAYGKASTVAVHYDISDPSAPVKLREHAQEGSYVSSGLYGNKLSLVTQVEISPSAAKSENSNSLIPSFAVNGEATRLTAEELFIAVNDPEASFLFITVTDIADSQKPVGRLAILGSGKEVYCSEYTVAVARGFVSVDSDDKSEHSSLTEIYRFEIGTDGISFAGSYIAKGTLAGGISADEKSGNLKVLTNDLGANNFYVLNKKMEFVSGLTGIFPDEKIRSIKYIGGNAYFVAGDDSEKTLIIDISDPAKPKTAGNISTEGFYRELYAVSDTALLGVGGDGGKISVTLFDVSNPASPRTSSVYTLEGNVTLPSADDGRCVLLDGEKMLFGIPVVNHNSATDTEISAYILFNVADGEITPVGTYNHDTAYTGDAAVRGISIGGTLYTVSGEKVTAFDIEGSTLISTQTLR